MSAWGEELDERVREAVEAELHRFAEAQSRAPVAPDSVGRILRAHLAVEIRLRDHVQALNPNLGPLDPRRFKLDLLLDIYAGLKDYSLPWLVKPLKSLNKIRNRFSHSLSATIDARDVGEMSRLLALAEGRDSQNARYDVVSTCEMFAMLAATIFGSMEAALVHKLDLDARLSAIRADAERLTAEFLQSDPTIEPRDGLAIQRA